MIITQTPFRMSFFGGGTDMESFFRENGGAVLSTTFDKYCYVNVRHLPRFFDYSTELSYSKTERVTCIEDIQHPAIRNAMKMLDIPVLEREIECLKNQGFDDIILTVSHLGNIIMDYFGDGSGNSPVTGEPFGVHIDYYFEEEPLGNAGALFKIKDLRRFLLLFSVHPEPEGRKVDKMLTSCTSGNAKP